MANKNRCTQCNRTLNGIREFWRLDMPPDVRFCSPQCRSDWERAKKEQDAHDEILRRCRATGIGQWVMRTSPSRRCLVINLSELELHPEPHFTGERRERHVAEGATWVEVLTVLDAA